MDLTISNKLFSFVEHQKELSQSIQLNNPPILYTFTECLNKSKVTYEDKIKIESIVDYLHELLHTGHWSNVSVEYRTSFTAASYLKALIILKMNNDLNSLSESLKALDLGLLLGAPLQKNSKLLTKSAEYLNKLIYDLKTEQGDVVDISIVEEPVNVDFTTIRAEIVHSENVPSMEYFIKHHYNTQTPLVIKGCTKCWPAKEKWKLNYLIPILGERTVPIEVGSQYSDENWSQKLMTVREFMKRYYLKRIRQVGYLAQHNLFDQVPELRDDIIIPEYCCTTRTETDDDPDVEINAWFGPENTISSLHHDPKDNILTQVFGSKIVLMFSPDDTEYLYPHGTDVLSNTSQVDPLRPDLKNYERFKHAKMYKCLLRAGDMLYMPPRWWHYVVSLEKSFSVNFWWT